MEDKFVKEAGAEQESDEQKEHAFLLQGHWRIVAVLLAIYDVIIVNFANCDMVGHTAVWEAIVKAVESVDECVKRVYEANKSVGGVMLLTADHGNADIVYDENNTLVTSHTTSPVPFVITDKSVTFKKDLGKLADIAPTLLTLMDYGVPSEMDGEILIENNKING